MSLTVLSVAFPFAPVGPSVAGGAEQILHLLDAGLVAGGHRSVVVARGGSQISGELIATDVPETPITDAVRASVTAAHQGSIDRALSTHQVDVIHLHGIDFDRYRLPRHIPAVVTLHLPPAWYSARAWQQPPHVHLVSVSVTQRAACAAFNCCPPALIGNAVPSPASAPSADRERYALMLSRICPEKNLHTGLDAARLAGVSATLAGETYPYAAHLRYLHEEIEPRLGPDATLLPPVGGQDKQRLLARARCVLVPSLAPETSSLVAMEALHAGTPVIAFPSGALPELIDHGRTGFLVRSVAEMASAIRRSGEIDPAACRAAAAQRFSLDRMIRDYVALYRSLSTGHTSPPPHSQPSSDEPPIPSQPSEKQPVDA